jgi:seryl-tRNA synthetase
MTKFFLYSGISAFIVSIVVGLISVSNNAHEINLRKEIKSEIKDYQIARSEFQKEMDELCLQLDSIPSYSNKICDCDVDSVVVTKLSKDSKSPLSEKDFKKAYRSLKKYRKIESKIYTKWEYHLRAIKAVEDLSGEKREILNIGNPLVYNGNN